MKNKFLNSILCLGLLFTLFTCEDEISNEETTVTEQGDITYGITAQEFLNAKAYSDILQKFTYGNSTIANRTDSLANQLSPESLVERLDLDQGYLNIQGDKELIEIPVRVQGDYMRSLLSLSRGNTTNTYLLTYPDSTNNKLYYVTTLDGLLLQKTTIGDDGIGVNEIYNSLNNLSSNSSSNLSGKSTQLCFNTTYIPCSSGQHSFAYGNAGDCNFWNNSGGTAPRQRSILVACGDVGSGSSGSSGTGSSSGSGQTGGSTGGGTNGNSDGFDGAPPVKGGSSLVGDDDCVSNLDCDQCNFGPIDLDGDCHITNIETTINQINNCMNGALTGAQKSLLANNPQVADAAYGAIGIICDLDGITSLLEALECLENGNGSEVCGCVAEGNSIEDCVLEELYNDMNKECQWLFIRNHIVNSNTTLPSFLKDNFLGNNTYNIQFSDIDIPSNIDANANLRFPENFEFNENTAILIEYDNTYLDSATNLSIILTTAHELVHSYLVYLYIEDELLSFNSEYINLNNAFDTYNQNPNNENGLALGEEMHAIYDDFIDTITESVYDYASNNNINGATLDYCQKLVIGSHQYTQAFQDLTPDEQEEYSTISTHEQNGNSEAKGNNCD
jgi:hypothetical protein